MELSRRDFMRNTAAFAAVASVLGTSGIAFAADADQNCLVKVDSPDRAELAKRFKAGSAAGVEYYAYNPRRYAPALKGKLPLIGTAAGGLFADAGDVRGAALQLRAYRKNG